MKTLKKIILSIITVFSILSCAQNPKMNTDEASNLATYSETIDTSWTKKIIKTDAQWKSILTSEQFTITREQGTEQPFTHDFHNLKENGIFICLSCNNPLFSKDTKFDSGTGWPSFFKPEEDERIEYIEDKSFGMVRVEVNCKRCGSHLGHVFDDGPSPTKLRYCINSLSLKLDKSD